MNTASAAPQHLFDPFDTAMWADPYPHYRRLRDTEPVHYVEHGDFWIVSQYDDIRLALADTQRFSSDIAVFQRLLAGRPPKPGSLLERQLGMGRENSPRTSMIMMDPPDHGRLRSAVAPWFRRRALTELEPAITQICRELIGRLVEKGASSPVDLMAELAIPLPLRVAATLLGVTESDHEYLAGLTRQFVQIIGGSIDPDAQAPSAEVMIELSTYVAELIADRRARPGSDVTSGLARAAESADISAEEALAQVLLILVAGFETTTNLIGNFFSCVLDSPDALMALRSNPALVVPAIEEALRYESPLQCVYRVVPEETVLHDVTIPASSYVELYLGSGNRDERHYPDPDVFAIARNPRDHLAFAPGLHNCLGAPVARLEARIAISLLLQSTAEIAHAGPVEMLKNMTIRGPVSLPIALRPSP